MFDRINTTATKALLWINSFWLLFIQIDKFNKIQSWDMILAQFLKYRWWHVWSRWTCMLEQLWKLIINWKKKKEKEFCFKGLMSEIRLLLGFDEADVSSVVTSIIWTTVAQVVCCMLVVYNSLQQWLLPDILLHETILCCYTFNEIFMGHCKLILFILVMVSMRAYNLRRWFVL